jgi:hypothetical protein
LDNVLGELKLIEFMSNPSNSSDWKPVPGGGVYEYGTSVAVFRDSDTSASLFTVGIYSYERDPSSQQEAWTLVKQPNRPAACLVFSLARAASLVPDAPRALAVLVYPSTAPEQARLIGTGRLDPAGLNPAEPAVDGTNIAWRRHSTVRAVYRSLPANGQDGPIEFAVRISGSAGEAIPAER